MTEPPERTICVFAIAERSFTIEDVIAAAEFRGELDSWWKHILFLDECEARSADLYEPEEAALQTAAEQFRYERDLITAEETEAWLDARGLTAEDFSNHFTRQYWAAHLARKDSTAPFEAASAPERLHDLLRTELLFSEVFDQLAFKLAASVVSLDKTSDDIIANWIRSERALFLQNRNLDAATVPAWLAKLQRDEAWLEGMLAMQSAYRLQRWTAVTSEAFQRTLSAMRIPLTRVQLEVVEFESLDAANEAILCVREDGMAMSAIAGEGGCSHRHEDRFLEEYPPELQQKLLCAAPGDLLEPIQEGDAFHLIRLSHKTEPSLDKSRINVRIEREILARHFTELSSRLVRWQPGFQPR